MPIAHSDREVQKYLKVFFSSMPKRILEFHELLDKKRRLDKNLQSSINKEEIIKELLLVIGKDNFFTPAETQKKKTLRHLVWKYCKSIKFFEKRKGVLIKDFKESKYFSTEFGIFLRNYLDLTTGMAKEIENLFMELDMCYHRQSIFLAKKQTFHYKEELKKEHELILNIQRMQPKIKNFFEYVKSVEKSFKHAVNSSVIYFFFEVSIMASMIFSVLAMVSLDAESPRLSFEFSEYIQNVMEIIFDSLTASLAITIVFNKESKHFIESLIVQEERD